MLISPSSARLRTISTRSDLRIEDETDGQRSTWIVLRMPPLLSFIMLCVARVFARLLSKVWCLATNLMPWVIFTNVSQRFIKLVALHLQDAFVAPAKPKTSEPPSAIELAEQIAKLKENIAKLNLENRSLRGHHQSLLEELSAMKTSLEKLYIILMQEEASKQMKPGASSLAKELVAEGYPQSSTPLSSPFRDNIRPTNNPKATIETTIDEFQTKLSQLYDGTAPAAWLRPPKVNDTITITFNEPVYLNRFKIGTGHFEYPKNTLTNANVDILPADSNDYITIGCFDQHGLAEGKIDHSILVKSLQIQIHNCTNWIIMSEVTLETPTEQDEYESW